MNKKSIITLIVAMALIMTFRPVSAQSVSSEVEKTNPKVFAPESVDKQKAEKPKKNGWFSRKPKNDIPTITSPEACSVTEPCDKDNKPEKEINNKPVIKNEGLSQKNKNEKKSSKKTDADKFDIETYLMLSQEQIEQAKVNRLAGEEKIKPINDEIKTIEAKVENIKYRNFPDDARAKQIERYEIEIRYLKSKANEVRKENVESFESILTPAQQQLFDDIKRINIQPVIKEE